MNSRNYSSPRNRIIILHLNITIWILPLRRLNDTLFWLVWFEKFLFPLGYVQKTISQIWLRSAVITILGCCLPVPGIVYYFWKTDCKSFYLTIMLFSNSLVLIFLAIFFRRQNIPWGKVLAQFKTLSKMITTSVKGTFVRELRHPFRSVNANLFAQKLWKIFVPLSISWHPFFCHHSKLMSSWSIFTFCWQYFPCSHIIQWYKFCNSGKQWHTI